MKPRHISELECCPHCHESWRDGDFTILQVTAEEGHPVRWECLECGAAWGIGGCEFVDYPNGRLWHHSRTLCAGEHCCIHNPSDHHMTGWPLILRADLPYPLMERICTHGCGHPDPDSALFLAARVGERVWVHGCCGCCDTVEVVA